MVGRGKTLSFTKTLYKANINRNDFASNGLSFLFNKYYNSVSAALAEAYPEKFPWEFGNIQLSFWTDENSKQAIHWQIGRASCRERV